MKGPTRGRGHSCWMGGAGAGCENRLLKGKNSSTWQLSLRGGGGWGGDALVLVGARAPGPRDTKPEDGPQRVSLA